MKNIKLDQESKEQIMQNYIREWEGQDKGIYKEGNDEGLKMGILIGVTSTLAFIVFSFIIFSI